jgi:hypothetical protein
VHRHRQIADQVVTVVGGSTVVGRAVALAAAGRRARVTVAGGDARALDQLAAEADVPHRFETVTVDPGRVDAAERVSSAATARFGLLHTWVHVVGRGGGDGASLRDVAVHAMGQLRRSGGGAFVVVAPEPHTAGPGTSGDRLRAEIDALGELVRERNELSSVTLVRRTGIVPPRRVADAVLRAAVHPRPEIVLRGSARRDAIVTRLVPARGRAPRPLGTVFR